MQAPARIKQPAPKLYLIASNPGKICYSHFGLRDDAIALLKAHRRQPLRWQSIVADEAARHPPSQAESACLPRLLVDTRRGTKG